MLQVRALHAGFGPAEVVNDVSLDAAEGEFVCLIGRNGVGKTTVLRSLMGLVKPRSGHVVIGDSDMTRAPARVRVRTGVGYVPQGRGIFAELSVMDNLRVAAEAGRAPRRAIDEAVDAFPALRPLLGRQAGALSGGQQQQLAFSRALVTRPKLLLLDEPTEGIQPSIILEIEQVLLRIKQSRTVAVLLVEQYLEFAMRLADRAYVMDRGTIVAQGKPPDLKDAHQHMVV